MKIVLDTNCLLASIPNKSPYRWLFEKFRKKRFTLCFTNEILEEYYEILSSYYSKELADNVINEILNSPNIEQITVYYKWNLITADPDDNKFVDCAISSNASFIITNDRHFNVLKKVDFPKVNYLSIQEFKDKV